MRKSLLIFVLAVTALLANCGGGSGSSADPASNQSTGTVVLQSIKISPSGASIAPGTNQAFTASGTYSDGSSRDLTLSVQWACLGTNAATVSNAPPTQGMATALLPGTVVIAASLGNISNNAVLTINNVLPTSLVVSPATATLGWGNQQQLKATATFSDNSQQDVTNAASWSSDLPFVTSGSGLVIGQYPGTNGILAFFGSLEGQASVTVDLSNLVSLSVSPAASIAANHTKLQFAALGTFVDGSTRDITSQVSWSSSNTGVADFISSQIGLITCATMGATTVTASATVPTGLINGSTALNVSGATLNSIVLYPANQSTAPSTKVQMTPIGVFSDSSVQDLTGQVKWSTSNSSSTSIGKTGIVTGIAAGSSTITATSSPALGSVPGSTQLEVTAATLNSIALTPANTFISPGSTLNFTARGTFSDGSLQDLSLASSWSSNPSNIATVKAAIATGQGLGQALVTAKSGTIRGTTNLMVASPQQIVVVIAPSGTEVAQQTSVQLSAQGTLTGGGKQDLTTAANWTSSSPTVATVGWQTGIVTGLAPGQTTIKATLGAASNAIQVKVTNASLVSITVTPASPSIALGSSQQFAATGTFSDGSQQALAGASWSSSNPTIAAVNSSGLANSTGTGMATIIATVNGVNGSTNLTVH
jgi:hypothetical protein